MNPNSTNPFQAYVSGGEKQVMKPIKTGDSASSPFKTYESRATNLKDTEGLYQLANQVGLDEEANKMIKRSGGENQKFMSGGFIMDVMDVLNIGSYGFVGMVKGKGFVEGVKNRESLSDDDALGKYGWQGKVAGFIGDILLDPLTYISPWKHISKIPGVSKGVTSATDAMFGKLVTREVGTKPFAGVVKTSVSDGGYNKILLDEASKYNSFDEFKRGINLASDSGIIAKWGTRNQYFKKMEEAGVLESNGGIGRNGELFELGLVANGEKPAFFTSTLPEEEVLSFAKKNKLPTAVDDNGRIIVGKTVDDVEAVLNAKNQRELGLALGYEDLGAPIRDAELKRVFTLAKKQNVIEELTPKQIAEQNILNEIETITIPGQKTFKREGGIGPLRFLAEKLTYGFAVSKEYLNGVQRIAGKHEAMLGDAEKLFKTISKLSPDLFNKTVTQGVDGRMISTPLEELEIVMKREGNDAGFETVKEMYGLRDRLMDRLVELQVLTKETKDAHWGTYLKQSYDEFLQSKENISGLKSGITSKSQKRVEDLTPEMMKELGQVQDGGVLWATTLLKQIDLVKKAELQKYTADGYAMTDDMLNEFMTKGGKMEDLHRVPPDPKSYGALAGKYVSKEIWNTLKGSFNPTKEVGENFVLAFKHLKVVWNPASHIRNAFSAQIQNWWKLGLGPWRMDLYYDAAQEFKTNGKYLQEMRDLGFSERSGYITELMDNYLANKDVIGNAMKNQLSPGTSVKKAIKQVDRLMLNSYGHTDNIAKVAAYKYGISKGLSKEDAYAQAMAATFNYSEITPFVHQMRRAIWGVPFITFALKATPLVAETLINNPNRISVFGKIRNDLFKAAGVEGEQETEAMPAYMRDDMFVMRVPWKDDNGRSMYFDMSYIIPFGALADGSFLKNPISSNPVLQFVRELSKNETFTGKKIFNESDDIETVLADIAIHTLKLGAPPAVVDAMPDGYNLDGSRANSRLGFENALPDAVQQAMGFDPAKSRDFGPGERTYYQKAFKMLGIGATPYDINSKESALAYTQRENLTKLLTENGVIKTFNTPYLPKDSEFRPENASQIPQPIYDRDVRPLNR